ncbi:hypothetical protein LTR66_003110 [Elasticomyces elasticus]|nr:hypothetical protein LTR66_003110 [Elasticomyces elasticus]
MSKPDHHGVERILRQVSRVTTLPQTRRRLPLASQCLTRSIHACAPEATQRAIKGRKTRVHEPEQEVPKQVKNRTQWSATETEKFLEIIPRLYPAVRNYAELFQRASEELVDAGFRRRSPSALKVRFHSLRQSEESSKSGRLKVLRRRRNSSTTKESDKVASDVLRKYTSKESNHAPEWRRVGRGDTQSIHTGQREDGATPLFAEAVATTDMRSPQSSAGSLDDVHVGNGPLWDKLSITEQLNMTFYGRTELQKSPTFIRFSPYTDIVSSDLCDEAISQLAPSLEEYKGCDIIDIHPGVCLFSRKLHAQLQPRRHLLLEPEQCYKPFYQPLLRESGSAYRHSVLPGAHPLRYWDNYDVFFDSKRDLLSPRERPAPDDPKLRKLDPSLLLVANLSRLYTSPRDRSKGITHLSKLMAYQILRQFSRASATNILFARYGLVRCLFWLPEPVLVSLLPRTITERTMGAAVCDLHWDYYAVARGKDGMLPQGHWIPRRRDVTIERRGDEVVAERMRAAGVELPENRRPWWHREALARLESHGNHKTKVKPAPLDPPHPLDPRYPYPVQASGSMADQVTDLEAYAQSVFTCDYKGGVGPGPEQDIMRSFQVTNWPAPTQKKQAGLLDVVYRLLRLEWAFAEKYPSYIHLPLAAYGEPLEPAREDPKDQEAEEALDLRRRLLKISADVTKEINALEDVPKKSIANVFENATAFFNQPQILAWDKRPTEPLVSRPEEFWPGSERSANTTQEVPSGAWTSRSSTMSGENGPDTASNPTKQPHDERPLGLALLDFRPKSEDYAVPDLADKTAGEKIGNALMKQVFTHRNMSITDCLDSLAAGAGRDLVPRIPELGDPRQGGRLGLTDPAESRAEFGPGKTAIAGRSVTPEMVRGLVRAYVEWPFKPDWAEVEAWKLSATDEDFGAEDTGIGDVDQEVD